VVIAIIAILAAMLLPALASAKKKAGQIACLSNQKQLALGLIMYADEFGDVMPSDATRDNAPIYGSPDQWLWWNNPSGLDMYDVSKTPMLLMIKSSTNVCLCPMDRNDIREATTDNKYYYSYTMNGHRIGASTPDGVASVHEKGKALVARKMSSIHRPSDIIMLAEEPVSSLEIQAGYSSKVADDGRWVSPENGITTRHNKRGNANFVDGHAQIVDNAFGADTNHVISTQ